MELHSYLLWHFGEPMPILPKRIHERIWTETKDRKKWAKLQWISTALLWVSWLLQDSANIAIFLPRKLSIYEFLTATSIVVFAMAMIILSNGGAIQEVVTEKSDIAYSKAATLVDIAYAIVLIVFQRISSIPMSTTWVFLGLLAGREIVLHLITKKINLTYRLSAK